MWILTQGGELVNTDRVSRVFITGLRGIPDVKIMAEITTSECPLPLGGYPDREKGTRVVDRIMNELDWGSDTYKMPPDDEGQGTGRGDNYQFV